ncbi:MAG: tetratricopeptide repeat protein [Flavobacteriales bacterium]
MILFLASCSKERNSLVNKGYHALTTRYNVFFNGNEKLKESEQKLYTGTVDEYQNIISVFPDGDESSSKEVASLLDISIQKASKGIDRHSMRFKLKNKKDGKTEEREVNPFIDDCYLLLGKSYFYKREFSNAANTFEYIAKEYDKKKIKYDALIWLMRAYVADEKYEEARKIIDKLDNDTEVPKKKKGYYLVAKAQYFIKTNDNKEAIKALNEALTFKAKKKLKTRWYYVLAQLQTREGNKTEAIAAYKKVTSGVSNYDMQFSAVIEMTKAQSAGNKSDDFARSLLKMAKEEKNKEYLDQIYYTVAQIYHQNGDEVKATEYYLLAANKSVKNRKQKALAFLAVAEINFKKSDYLGAASYYDSSLTVMPAEDALYEPTEIKKNNLKDLVVQIEIINTQDSLLTLAKMPEEARLKKIDKTIARFIEEEDQRKEQELLNADAATKQNNTLQSDQSGKWYFYNPSLVSAGKAKFAALWGQRKLEDNWRRKNKSSAAFGAEEETTVATIAEATADAKRTREYYLKDIPKTEKEIAASEEKLGDAYFTLGTLYKDKMEDDKSSIVTFEEMNSKLPNNKNELKSYYLLYRMNLSTGNTSRANYYKNLIETKYPSSEYLRLINNPNAAKEDEEKEKALSAQYEHLFNEYKKGNYALVKEQTASLINENPKGAITPQLALLNAFSVGKTSGPAAFTEALTKVKANYPGSDAATSANDILNKDDQKSALVVEEKKEGFEVKEEAFYFVLIVNEKDNNIADLQKSLSDFSTKYYGADKLQMQTVIWSESEKVIIVKSFAKANKAIDFYSTIPEKVFSKYPNAGNKYFPISVSNYAKLFKDKNVEEYKVFFENSY